MSAPPWSQPATVDDEQVPRYEEHEPDIELVDPSFQPVDLAPVVSGDVRQPVPAVLQRDDGQSLFYAGQLNGLHGVDGAGKSWVANLAVAQDIARGHQVMILDLEDGPTSIVARLRLLGATDDQIIRHVTYIRPQASFSTLTIEHLVDIATDRKTSLIVVDSIGEAFGLDGVDENHDSEVGPWLRRVARPLADTGAAVVLVDHGTKAADNPLFPSGSKRKRAAVGGAAYLVEATVPLRAGDGGRLRLTCAKDRHGTYRRGEHVADIVLTPTPIGGLVPKVYAPSEPTAATVGVVLAAREAVRIAHDSDVALSMRTLLGLMTVKARRDVLIGGIELAVGKGALTEIAGPRGARMFTYVGDLEDPS